jgi:hypothetical protein
VFCIRMNAALNSPRSALMTRTSPGDQTTASAPGKKVWQPKSSFEDKMAARRSKDEGGATIAPGAASMMLTWRPADGVSLHSYARPFPFLIIWHPFPSCGAGQYLSCPAKIHPAALNPTPGPSHFVGTSFSNTAAQAANRCTPAPAVLFPSAEAQRSPSFPSARASASEASFPPAKARSVAPKARRPGGGSSASAATNSGARA